MEDANLTQVQGNWIETYTGKQFNFMKPMADAIDIQDVAHALSMACRYAGHTREFYSVAEHSVLMMKWAEKNGTTRPEQLLTILLHDASEAYIGDMTRPLKAMFPLFKEIEEKLHYAVACKFGSLYPHPDWLKTLDTRILVDEREQATSQSEHDWGLSSTQRLGVRLHFWAPETAKAAFLREFERVCAMLSVKEGNQAVS